MSTPGHIDRIIERLDPVDREALEQHLNESKFNLDERRRLHRELAEVVGHDAEAPSLCDLVAAVQLVRRERDELEQKHKGLLHSYQDLQALRNRSGVDLEHALRGTVREGAWQPDDRLKRVAELAQERNALGRERNELSASCHQLTLALQRVIERAKEDDPEVWSFAERVLAATPAANLSEVRAQAIEQFAKDELSHNNVESFSMKNVATRYADRIRKEAQ